MPFPFAIIAPVVTAVGSAAAAAGTAMAAGAAAVGSAAAAGAAAVGTAAAVTAATLGTTGMVVAGVAAATAIIVVVACITIAVIKEKARERARELSRRAMCAKIHKTLEEGEYNTAYVGLYDNNDNLIDEMAVRAEDMDDDVYEGRRISLAS